jgi:type IV pilus assembly protein PilY1
MLKRTLKTILGVLVAGGTVASLNAQMAQDPLLSRTASVPPNVVLMFDDSGSMQASAIYQYGGKAGGMGMTGPGAGDVNYILTTAPYVIESPDVNLMYYDPRTTYSKRVNADGSFQAPGSITNISSFNVYFYKATSAYGVQSVSVSDAGFGYPSSGATAVFSSAPPGGVTATGTVTVASTQTAASVAVTNPGSGYAATGVTAAFSAPATAGGRTATGTVLIGTIRRVNAVTVSNGGSNYPANGVTATFSPPSDPGGATATGTVTVSAPDTVNSVTVLTGGSGYGTGTTVTFSAPPAGGVRATGTMTRGTSNAGRPIISINITNAGSGYTSPPTISLSNTNGGTGATFAARLGGTVTSINLTNPGSGYSSPPTISLSGTGSGAGATFNVTTSATNIVTGISITDAGSGYTSAPTITLNSTGGGSGAAFTVSTGTTNVISGITITNPGSGYAKAPSVTLSNSEPGVGAKFSVTPLSTAITAINRTWTGTDTPTALSNYFNPSYTPDGGSPLAAGATAVAYPNTADSTKTAYPKFRDRTDCGATSCSWTQEQQNYANWKLYHSTRLELAKTGIGLSFQPLNPTFRLGWATINNLESNSSLDSGVQLYNSTTQSKFLTWLYGLSAPGNTPNRIALDKVGQYFQRADAAGPWATDPAESVPAPVASSASEDTTHASCRRSYALLMTDGYYNEDFTTPDVDSLAGPSITQGGTYKYSPIGPYSDTASGVARSNTFADVAMKYWVNDLRPNLKNQVKPTSGDEAFWQHLNFYAIGLGITGTLDATDPEVLRKLTGNASTPPYRSLDWPAPSSNDPTAIDDMWHATVNGRGKLLNAKSASQLNSAVNQLMGDVGAKEGTQSGVAVSAASLSSNTKKYTPSYTPITWNGNVTAYSLDPTSGNQSGVAWQVETLVSTDPLSGAKTFSSIIPSAATRNIYVGNGATSGNRAVPFKYSDMSSAGLTSVMTGTVSTELIDFLRGDPTNEDASATTSSTAAIYRGRPTRLGDIINSTPVFVKDTLDMYYDELPAATAGQSSYRAFVNTKKQRPEGMLFVGANDGMLHGFRDGIASGATVVEPGGIEKFAYVPNALLPTLNQLADKSYVHRYYVDGPNIETDAYFTSGGARWANIVIGTTGAGAGAPGIPGNSPRTAVYAIDVTSLNTNTTSLDASKVLWEVSSGNTDFGELGYVLSDVQTGPTLDGSWVAIFGNGYESKSCKAQLFVVNIQTGALIRKIDTGAGDCSTAKNGLGGVSLVRNAKQQIIGAYAGDLRGNLWKFNLNNSSTSTWGVDLGGNALFTAGNSQPITATPSVIYLSSTSQPAGGYMVIAGTGKFYEVSDITSTAPQTLYGIWDKTRFGASVIPTGAALTDKTLLVEQTIGAARAGADNNTYFEISRNPVDYVGTTTPSVTAARRGWYTNLPNVGQRLTYPINILANRIAVADTISPANVSLDPCSNTGGGVGYLYAFDALSGAGPKQAILDTNGDSNVDSTDLIVSGVTTAADGRNAVLNRRTDNTGKDNRVGNGINPGIDFGGDNPAGGADRAPDLDICIASGADPSCKTIQAKCEAWDTTCTNPDPKKFKSREWRQLFMR